jgi:hypothetical protein
LEGENVNVDEEDVDVELELVTALDIEEVDVGLPDDIEELLDEDVKEELDVELLEIPLSGVVGVELQSNDEGPGSFRPLGCGFLNFKNEGFFLCSSSISAWLHGPHAMSFLSGVSMYSL